MQPRTFSHLPLAALESSADTVSVLERDDGVLSIDLDDDHDMMKDELKEDIVHAIAPHTNAHTKPPFSNGELTILALCCCGFTADLSTMSSWLCATFASYKDEAMKIPLADIRQDLSAETSLMRLIIAEALNDLGVPVQYSRRYTHHLYSRTMSHWVLLSTESRVRVSPARLYLRRVLEPARKGHFRFLDLPAELRNTIYEMVFSYHKTGIEVRYRMREVEEINGDDNTTREELEAAGPVCELTVLARETDQFKFEEGDWADQHDYERNYSRIPLHETETTFALLSVNKQIYEEAMPTFYEINSFYFKNLRSTKDFANRLAASRMAHLKDIYIRIKSTERDTLCGFDDAMHRFASHCAPKRIQIEVDDEGWLEHTKGMELNQIPGFKSLVKVICKAEEVQFHGDCTEIEKSMGDMMKQMTEDVQKKLLGREEGSETPNKRAKMTK